MSGIRIQKFTKEIEAVYFDGSNDAQEIAQWCGGMIVELVGPDGKIRKDMCAIDVPCPGGFTTAGAGFYIFRDGPSFFAMDKGSFEASMVAESG